MHLHHVGYMSCNLNACVGYHFRPYEDEVRVNTQVRQLGNIIFQTLSEVVFIPIALYYGCDYLVTFLTFSTHTSVYVPPSTRIIKNSLYNVERVQEFRYRKADQ